MALSEEKRHFSRITMDGPVRLVCGQRVWETRLTDISLKGVLVDRPSGWEGGRGTGCQVEVMDGDNQPLIVMKGGVAHIHPDHIGFHCESIDLDSVSHLKRLLQLNLGDETLLQRELGELLAVQEAT